MSEVKPGAVSIYELMAHLFADIAREVEGRFGVAGEAAIRDAVRKFGEERGQNMALAVAGAGKLATAANYLPFYDMERSELFVDESDGDEHELRQDFSKCIFAETWSKLNMEKYGLFYCEEIDPAIARGYNEKFKCHHNKYLLKGDGCCSFKFIMEDN
jgi:hypothetical protein